ncbi:hypothetical protein DSC45_05590 [Streptomyces sp. YIM 130001]|uniref:DUF6126 family protein n=1 Tax=Streptomyces sp. YIM 130001 TaxID=2259644 RepID=UPI000E64E894|nr:DUF6126 family protein [Streptomyces sp. YIM 130001]RII20681.1 hypothetical protein DSC45_05590 [Streptomyces sp. YIM 130001]
MSEFEAAGAAKGAGPSEEPVGEATAGEATAGTKSGEAVDVEAVAGQAPGEPVRVSPRKRVEETIPRGLWIRLFVYFVAGHLLAGFIYLLFTLGGGQ